MASKRKTLSSILYLRVPLTFCLSKSDTLVEQPTYGSKQIRVTRIILRRTLIKLASKHDCVVRLDEFASKRYVGQRGEPFPGCIKMYAIFPLEFKLLTSAM